MKLKVVHISYSDNHGGAAKLAQSIIDSQGDIDNAYLCARPSSKSSKLLGWGKGNRAGLCLKLLHKASCFRNCWLGDTSGILSKIYLKQILSEQPDLVHFHNIHGGWFDLCLLKEISCLVPVVWTLHDEWMYTGHCVATFGCNNWKCECINCPSLDTMYKLHRDTTHKNWLKRKNIYNVVAKNKVVFVPVSNWLGNRLGESKIWSGAIEVIPNGINTDVFYPVDRSDAKKAVGLKSSDKVLIFVAEGGVNNPFKNGNLFFKMLDVLSKMMRFKAIVLGGVLKTGNPNIICPGYISNVEELRTYYSAADMLVYPTKADTFGLVVAEAMACGTPVIATKVGGVSEQICEGKNGFLVEPDISEEKLAQVVLDYFINKQQLIDSPQNISKYVNEHYSSTKMKERYLNLYHKMLGTAHGQS